MTNGIVIALALAIAAAFALDALWLHLDLPVLAGKAALDLIDWVSFWR